MKKKLSWNFIIKQLLTIGLIAINIVDLYYNKLNQSIILIGSDILYYAMNLSTMLLSMIVLTVEWWKQIHTSWIFSLFWPLFLCSLVPQLLVLQV